MRALLEIVDVAEDDWLVLAAAVVERGMNLAIGERRFTFTRRVEGERDWERRGEKRIGALERREERQVGRRSIAGGVG